LLTDKRRALISVSDKAGIVELAVGLIELGFEIISTGGTARTLRDAGLKVTDASSVTGFPEILGGRVKTLHPTIHAAILARIDQEDQRQELRDLGINPIELVVVNLYPFEQTVAREGVELAEAVENIDIGGPTMLRAAAKNHTNVAVVVNPDRYAEVLNELKSNGSISSATRLSLAAETFNHTAGYDTAIAAYFKTLPEAGVEHYPDRLSITFNKVQNLRYGENPQQVAAFYAAAGKPAGLAAAEQLQGKELSFNNLNDLNAAWELVSEFKNPTAVAVKHANPCGVGSALTLEEAYRLAFEADPVSIFGGVVALNRPVDAATAAQLSKIFLEVIAAPQFTEDAVAVLQQKKDIRLLQMDAALTEKERYDIKKIAGGVLLQSIDAEPVDVRKGAVVTERVPTEAEWEALSFAQTVVKHVRSNAIVIAGSGQTYGIGAGQMSRIGAARIALNQAGDKAKGAALGSDAFFPFSDTVEEAASAGVTAIVQPGGSLKDQETIEACDRLGLTMVLTGRRYFKH
jgi:phosphoribosylaminoimidazolecarboxamide formyltransferase / IMP cyclohydrolase